MRRVVVAITKCDLGDASRTAKQVREQIGDTSLGIVPIVPTSVRSEFGLEELKQTLAEVCASLPGPPDIGKPRLFVDRVFTVRGTGTVVTGTLTGGQLARGEIVSLQPQNLRTRIRAIQSHNQPIEVALPATRTALNLPDLRVEEIPRGTVLTTVENTESSRTIDVLVERSGRTRPTARPLKKRVRDPGALRQRPFRGPDHTARSARVVTGRSCDRPACVALSRPSFLSAIVSSSAIRQDEPRSRAASCSTLTRGE